MKIEIKDLDKVSYNVFSRWHWTKKNAFNTKLKWQIRAVTNKQLTGGYNLDFEFTFKGRRLDTINVVHFIKAFEDALFAQDKDNRTICINVKKGSENKCILELTKIDVV